MTCQQAKPLIDPYADGELETSAISELEQHLRLHIEATHIPTVWRFVDTLPYTPMMKPDRLAVRRAFETEAVA